MAIKRGWAFAQPLFFVFFLKRKVSLVSLRYCKLPSMKKIFALSNSPIFYLLILILSCGSDPVEGVIDTYLRGEKKVFVRFHPDEFILEKYIYNPVGELVHFERDSLGKTDDFETFMLGTWIMDNMSLDGEILFEQDSLINPDSSPNLYNFTSTNLIISGQQYVGDYKITYMDSTQVELDGKWEFGVEGEDTYRSQRVYDIDYFQILSYNKFIWTGFLEDEEKEEEVIFRRYYSPEPPALIDTVQTTE